MMNLPVPLTTEYLIIIFLAVGVVVLTLWIIRIERKLKILLATKNAETIDDTLAELQKNINALNTFCQEADTHISDLEQRVQQSISGVETVRFNPFVGDGSGGKHSFATALISERGDGIVISSLYTRERTNIFSKRVQGLKADQELSEEEQEVMHKAHNATGGTS